MFLDEALGMTFNQAQVDFINPNLDIDLRLYVDPFQFYKSDIPQYHAVHTQLVKFFEIAIDKVRNKENHIAKRMLIFPEVPEAMIGLCSKGFDGRGVGRERGSGVYEAIVADPEIQKKGLRHIEELQIKIENVGFDMISDMTLNIAKQFFIIYTQAQAKVVGIPLVKMPLENIFDFDSLEWDGGYHYLPVDPKTKRPILFIPKHVVRTMPEINTRGFYDDIYRHILMARELERSLRVLAKPIKVSWEDTIQLLSLKKRYKKSWKDLPEYSKEEVTKIVDAEPELLDSYITQMERGIRKTKRRKQTTLAVNSVKNSDERYTPADDYLNQLRSFQPGKADARKYQNLMTKILIDLFGNTLSNPQPQDSTRDGLEIRDLTFWNGANGGFWLDMKKRLKSVSVTFELKNYTGELTNDDFNQLSGYLNPLKGQLGFLVCRNAPSAREIARSQRKLMKGDVIIILCDSDIADMLKLRDQNKDPEDILKDYYRKL